MLNNVWRQFTKLGSPVGSSRFLDNEFSGSVVEVGEFETPEAANTTVLVTGATGRWGLFGIYHTASLAFCDLCPQTALIKSSSITKTLPAQLPQCTFYAPAP